jgi:uncharacterized protein YfdQ (DUF2303 family)
MADENDTQTAAHLALSTVQAAQVIKLDDNRVFALVPNGPGESRLEQITTAEAGPLPIPQAVFQRPGVQDVDSLIAYANRFKNANSALFANIAQNRIVAVIDYHAAADTATGKVAPNLLGHSAMLDIPYSEEWKTWIGIDGKLVRQLDFVRFIEDNAPDITSPSAADLIEICRDMQSLRKVNFTNVVRTASNSAEKFEYTNENNVNAKGGVEIPTAFDLALPVYFNGAIKAIKARLRYELDDGTLKLGIKLLRPENLRQETFREIVEQVRSETALTTVYGQPGNGWMDRSGGPVQQRGW